MTQAFQQFRLLLKIVPGRGISLLFFIRKLLLSSVSVLGD